jgi:5-formyltetrahydrofolate cyclo-ligase
MVPPFATKADARASARAARDCLTPAQRLRYNTSLARHVAGLPEIARADAVLTYAAAKGEADPNDFVQFLQSGAPILVFPRVAKNYSLTLHACSAAELQPGAFGIPEPTEHHPPRELTQVQVVLLPGVAFDQRGGRIGYGKGYYDRLLAQRDATRPFLIGITFDETLYDELPTTSHDQRVDLIVTPSHVIRL